MTTSSRLSSMRQLVIGLGLGLLAGLLVGWLIWSTESAPQQSERVPEEAARATRAEPLMPQRARWMPSDERVFLYPTTEEQRAEVRRAMRAAIEQEDRFPTRMKAVCDLLALMTPENAHEIRDAFEESWNAGFNYNWERSVFFGRYGEVMGAEAAEEFPDHSEYGRILASWSTAKPDEAVAWTNDLEPGERQLEAVRWIILGAGKADPKYGIQVFESLIGLLNHCGLFINFFFNKVFKNVFGPF